MNELANRLRYELRPSDVPGMSEKHHEFVKAMLQRESIGFQSRRARIKELRDSKLTAEQEQILNDVETYIEDIAVQYGV